MGDSAIGWTGKVWNPVTGCDRVSPGCASCYAMTFAKRLKAMGQEKYQNDGDPATSGPGFGLTLHSGSLSEPLGWKKPSLIFVNSMSDLFHADVPDEFIDQVFAVMALTPQHTYQVLTKRPQRMAKWANHDFLGEDRGGIIRAAAQQLTHDWQWDRPVAFDPRAVTGPKARPEPQDPNFERRPPPVWPLLNVWMGTSIESDLYTFRADHLRATPAAVRFLSLEPLLGPLPSLNLNDIDWVIAGGESGAGARPMHPEWVRSVRDRCVESKVAFFFKQWGAWAPAGEGARSLRANEIYVGDPFPSGWRVLMRRVGKSAAGRDLDGCTWDEMPTRETAVLLSSNR